MPDTGNFTTDLTGYTRTDLGGTTGGTTVADGFATLREGDRFRVGLSRAFTVSTAGSAIVVTFEAPDFDSSSSGRVKDAFEIAVLAADGSPLALPTAPGRDAAFNWTEGFTATGGPATTVISTAAMITLSELAPGTPAQLVLRLVNNDGDTGTSVRIRRVDFVSATSSRLVRFSNPNRERFTYDLQVLAGMNHAPTLAPLADAEAVVGRTFAVTAVATDPDEPPQTLTYRMLAGPEGLTLDLAGRILFTPQAGDVGTHSARVRVTDSFGATADGGFTLTVRAGQPNRPPIFTSTPPTDATVAAPFEVRTYATGNNPVAVAAGNFGKGVSIITADRGDQNLGQLTGPQYSTATISVGELNPDAYGKHPVMRAAKVDLGFEPGTYLNYQRDVYGVVAADVNRDGNPDFVASVVLGADSFDTQLVFPKENGVGVKGGFGCAPARTRPGSSGLPQVWWSRS